MKVRNMEKYQEVERSIIKTYRKEIWHNFIKAIREYEMIEDGDKIAVCISGGKDSMLMAKCFQELKKHGKQNFEVIYICMNPGYNEENRQRIIENSKLLNIPIKMFETDIFDRVAKIESHPCYLCARMRRGHLYEKAKEMGCNKIALGHHFDDVIETILMGMFYGAQMQTMMPKIRSTSHRGMQLIRPMYFVKETDILNWKKYNNLQFINCACRFVENCSITEDDEPGSKREEMKRLIKKLRLVNPKVDINIFRSAQNVNLNTLLSYTKNGKVYNFLDEYKLRGKNMEIEVKGMHCEGCEKRIQNVLKTIDGIEEVVADHNTGKVSIKSTKEINLDEVKTKIEDLDFEVVE